MKKILKPFILIAVLIVFVNSLHSLLIYEPIDNWLTSKFSVEEENDFIINTSRSKGVYSLNETEFPCIYAKENNLYMVIGDITADITPEDINMTYYSKVTDFNEMINKKENYLLSNDGNYILYRLTFKGNPYLYMFDIKNENNIFISDRVESFDLIENEAGNVSVIFATGYDNSNKLFEFKYNPQQNAEYKCLLLADDIESAGAFDKYGSVVYLDKNGNLCKYDTVTGENLQLHSKVESVYYPEEDEYNYQDYYSTFTVCAKINGKDYILNEESKIEIDGGYYNVIPKYVYNKNGNIYYYSVINKKIALKDNKEKILCNELGDILHVFGHYQYDESSTGYFVVATEDSLYLMNDNGSKAEKMMSLSEDYCGFSNMLENHMDVYMVAPDTFYVNELCEGSLILNNKNSNSWLCESESYNYGLTTIKRTENGFESIKLDVPSSRAMSRPFAESSENKDEYIYVSYYDDMTIKSVALINNKGQVVLQDILGTSSYAKGQAMINVLPSNTGTYFIYQNPKEKMSFYRFDAKELCLYHVEDENGIFTENYDEFNGVVSFGTLVIF